MNMMSDKMARKNIRDLIPYSSARDEAETTSGIYLDANENPFPNGVNRYPDPHQRSLRERIALIKNIHSDQLLLGNGSDEIIDLIFRSYCNPGADEIIITPPTYGMYKVLAQVNDIHCSAVLLLPDFSLNVVEILKAVNERTKIIVLCSPNNPGGNLLSAVDIQTILKSFEGLVLLDEAYIDFAPGKSWISKLESFPNLIICQTLSKAWGMAGLRVGMAIADKSIIQVLRKVKPPYNINQLTQDKALELLMDDKGFDKRLLYLLAERVRLMEALSTVSLVQKIFPSDANFLLLKFEEPEVVYQSLVADGIIVRNRSAQPLCEGCLRITIGLKEENDLLITSLKKISS